MHNKYDEKEVQIYALDHTIAECADYYELQINSMYTYFNQHHITYKHVFNNSITKKSYHRIMSDESFDIAQKFGRLTAIHPGDGWKIIALGVLAYAKIDNDMDFPTKNLFMTIINTTR